MLGTTVAVNALTSYYFTLQSRNNFYFFAR